MPSFYICKQKTRIFVKTTYEIYISMNINDFGFLRVAAASPKLRVADCDYNLAEIKTMIGQAIDQHVQIICFPELSITGYTCGDLFFQVALQEKAKISLLSLVDFMQDQPSIIAIVGLPLHIKGSLYNVAAVVSHEGILGCVPKSYLPNSNEFYEKRWFASAYDLNDDYVEMGDEAFPVGSQNMIFKTPFGSFGIEICEDMWQPVPPSCRLALHGAEVIFNLSASNELVGKNPYRRSLVLQQSGRCHCAYVYAGAGCGESSTDLVFSGACFIAENGSLLAEGTRFSLENEMIISDIDLTALRHERVKNSNFRSLSDEDLLEIDSDISAITTDALIRKIHPHPFIPAVDVENQNLNEVFTIQVHGLVKRLQHTHIQKVTIGISGGLDSTLALLVTVKAFDLLQIPRENIIAITMPGLGTTNRTYRNALSLIQSIGATCKEISIVNAVNQHFKDIEHDASIHDITYENAQARERTQILMDYANKINGLVIGTGNLSELALGWATYNGDQMSMYGLNASVPKTLVKSLVRWIADTQMDEQTRAVLHDILDTPFSPELLPATQEGNINQVTEDAIGPYELHDFFLYRMLRYGDAPKRILFLAQKAFENVYTPEVILRWLKVFYKRFFAQQFKRSCMPDGPKVGSVNLSPRGDWRMPSDAVVKVWMDELE